MGLSVADAGADSGYAPGRRARVFQVLLLHLVTMRGFLFACVVQTLGLLAGVGWCGAAPAQPAGAALPPVAQPATAAWAQGAAPVFERLDPRDLPHRVVSALAQDAAGFLWIGTQGGLARFDGYGYRVYRAQPDAPGALPDGYIHALLTDRAGKALWLGTGSSGLVHFDTVGEQFTTHAPAGGPGQRIAKVTALAHADNGALWVGGDSGLSLFDPALGRFQPMALLPGAQQPAVLALLVDSRANVWVGSAEGLYVRWAGQEAFQPLALASLRSVSPAGRVFGLMEDSRGHLWVGGTDVVLELDPRGQLLRHFRYQAGDSASLAHGQQGVMLEVEPGTLWVGSSQQGLSSVDIASGRVTRLAPDANNPHGLRSADLSALLRDRSGLVWLGNWDGGLLRYNPRNRGIRTISALSHDTLLPDPDALALAVGPGGRLWVGGKGGTLAMIAPALPRTPPLRLRPDGPPVWALAASGQDEVLVGTGRGLCVVSAQRHPPACPARPAALAEADVRDIAVDGRVVWLGTGGGLLRWDRGDGSVRAVAHEGPGGDPAALQDRAVTAVYLDQRRRVWTGLRGGGVAVLEPATGRTWRLRHDAGDAQSIGPGTMYAFLHDRQGRMWVGAAGGGLNLLEQPLGDGPPRFRHLGLAQGLPHDNVYALAQDAQGRIWASTPKGLALIDAQNLSAQAMGLGEGVAIDAYWPASMAQDSDGTIFFGGIGGVTAVLPDQIEPWAFSPALAFTSLRAGGERLREGSFQDGTGQVVLPVAARALSAEFAALDYSAPGLNRYQYRLAGFDKDWLQVDADHRVASYTNLPPGDYVLEVRGSNRRGQWSPHGLRLQVQVPAAWYETWWLRGTAAFLLVALFTALARWRARLLLRRQHELQALVAQRTTALSEANAALARSAESLLEKNRELERLSTTDRLTGLFNRHKLDLILQEEHARSLRYGSVFSIALMDLDHFKSVNDTHGHHVGDAVLLEIAQLLAQQTRGIDVVGRWGGEEFLLVFRETTLEGAWHAADHLRQAIAGHSLRHVGHRTASFGVACWHPGDAVTDLMARADAALYRAKANGRDRVEVGAVPAPA